MDSLALGAMLACLESSGRLNAVVPMAWRVVLGIGAILVICSFFYPRSPETTLPLIFYHGAVALFFGAIVALAVCGAFRWLDNRVLREVGQKSYGMYVFHVPLLVLASTTSTCLPTCGVGGASLPGGHDLFFLHDHHHVPGRVHQLQCLRKTLFET